MGGGGCLSPPPHRRGWPRTPVDTSHKRMQRLLNDTNLEEGGCRQGQVGVNWVLGSVRTTRFLKFMGRRGSVSLAGKWEQ